MFSLTESVAEAATSSATSSSASEQSAPVTLLEENSTAFEPAAKRVKMSKTGAVPDLISLQKQTLDAVTELVAVEKQRLEVEKQLVAMKKVKLLAMGHVQLDDGSWLCRVGGNARAKQFASDDRDEE